MTKRLTMIIMLFALIITGHQVFAQKTKSPISPNYVAPIDPGDGGGGGGGGPPPPGGAYYTGGGVASDGNRFILWEGNNGTQDKVWADFVVANYSHQLALNNGGTYTLDGQNVHPNDEARSMTIQGAVAGKVIEVYDSPSGSTSDDWTQIIVKQAIPITDKYILFSFESSYEDAYVRVIYHPHNGLDGKVSFFKVY